MRIIGSAVLLALALVSDISLAGESSEEKNPSQKWKPKTQALIPSEALSGVPGASAGCLAMGYHILKDGSVARVRVMQGAYTRDVPVSVQETFAQAALKTVAGWAFKGERGDEEPVFGWEVVGFAPVDGRPLPVIGTMRQDDRVRAACDITDLAAWGERNALPLDSPEIVRDGRILAPPPEQPRAAVWIVAGDLAPPRYPAEAARAGLEGCVVVGFVVGNDGKTDQFRVMKSPGGPIGRPASKWLENAALYAASQWKFSPGPDNPRRMPALLQIPVDFSLGGSSINRPCNPVDIKKLQ